MKKQKKNAITTIILVLILALSACSGGNTNSSSSDNNGSVSSDTNEKLEIRIGVTAPLSGPSANSGIGLRQGMEYAAELINEKGFNVGNKDARVKLIFEDTQSKPEHGVGSAEKLINDDKVHFLIGDSFNSSVTMAIMDLADQYEMPTMSAASVSEAIANKVKENPDAYKYFWKMYYGSGAYGQALIETYQYLDEKDHITPKNKTIAFIVEDTDFGRSNAEYTVEAFRTAGYEVVAEEYVPMDNTEFYPQFSKVKSLNPDVIISCFTSLSSGVSYVKQFQEQDIKATSLGIYYPNIAGFKDQAGDAANGHVWTALTYAPQFYEHQKEFAAGIEAKLGVESTSDQANGYDSIYNIVNAFITAGSIDPQKVNKALGEQDENGLNGRYVFDQSNHQSKSGADFMPLPSVQIQGGKDIVIWPENLQTGEFQTP